MFRIKFNQDAGAPAGGSTTTTPAPTPAGGNAATPPATPTPADWTASLKPELKGYVQTKEFKDPATVVEAYQNLEKLMGARERLIKTPEKDDDVQGWNEVYTRLGKPAKADDYKIAVPEGQGPEFANWAKGTFHELNLTGKQAEQLSAKWNEYVGGMQAQQQQQYQQQAQQQEAELKREWGAAYEAKIGKAKAAATRFGIEGAMIDKMESALGLPTLMKFLSNIGEKIGEDSFVTGQRANTMTPEQARQRITSLQQDKAFFSRLMSGDDSAKREWNQLNEWATPPAN